MLEGWRQRRAPEIADVVDRVASWIDLDLPAIEGTGAALEDTWFAAAEHASAADLDRLLAALRLASPAQAVLFLESLANWPADPRLSRAFLDHIERPAWTGGRAQLVFARMLQRVEGDADWRTIARLHALLPSLPDAFEPALSVWMRSRLPRCLHRVEARHSRGVPRLTASEAAQVRAVLRRVEDEWTAYESGRRQERDLLARIYASPDDDAARLVYADLLSARSDPRGEFIVLQLSEPDPQSDVRQRKLVQAHGREWLGDLAWVLSRNDLEWERGFPVRGSVRANRYKEIEPLVGHPAWATFRDLLVRGDLGYRPLELVLHPVLEALRVVRGIRSIDQLEQVIVGDDPLSIEEIWCTRHPTDWARGAFYRFEEPLRECRLPNLRKIVVDNDFVPALSWLADGLPGRQLTEVEARLAGRPALPDWLQCARTAGWQTVRLVVRQLQIELQQQDDGDLHLVAQVGPEEVGMLAGVLDYTPADKLRHVEVNVAGDADTADLERVLLRFSHAEMWPK